MAALGCDAAQRTGAPPDGGLDAARDLGRLDAGDGATLDARADAAGGRDAGGDAGPGASPDTGRDGDLDAELDAELDAGRPDLAPADAAALPACPTFGDPVALGNIESAAIWEASGIVESRRLAGVLWTLARLGGHRTAVRPHHRRRGAGDLRPRRHPRRPTGRTSPSD
ncbi:MAG: hypothetical protein R3F43_28630 [bacterium]